MHWDHWLKMRHQPYIRLYTFRESIRKALKENTPMTIVRNVFAIGRDSRPK